MHLPGSKVVTVLIKGFKTEKNHDTLTDDDNMSIIEPVRASLRPYIPSYNNTLERGEKLEEGRLSGQSTNMPG